MARYGKKTIYTLIEFGTDKICVMYGTRSESGRPEVLSFAQRPSAGSVYKNPPSESFGADQRRPPQELSCQTGADPS